MNSNGHLKKYTSPVFFNLLFCYKHVFQGKPTCVEKHKKGLFIHSQTEGTKNFTLITKSTLINDQDIFEWRTKNYNKM